MSSSRFARRILSALVASLAAACGSVAGHVDGSPDVATESGADVTRGAPDVGADAAAADTHVDASPDVPATTDVTATVDAVDVPDALDAPPSIAPNATCDHATPVADGTHAIAQDPHGATAPDPTCLYTSGYGVLYYSATIPAGDSLIAVVTPTTGDLQNAYIGLLDHCAPSNTCLDQQESGVGRTTLAYRNDGSAAIDVIIVVADQPETPDTQFDLTISIRGTDTTTTACAAATPVTDGTMTRGSTGASPDVSTACLLEDSGTVAYYSALVPAGQVLVARAQIPGAMPYQGTLSIRMLASCSATSCLTAVDEPATGEVNVASYYNPDPGTHNVIIEIGSWLDEEVQPFDLSVQIAAPALNATCASATPVADGAMLTGEDSAFATTGETACDARDTGNVLYYSVTIPSAYTLVATPTGPGGAFAALATRLLADCAATSCLANASARTVDGLARVIYTNTSAASLDAILAVGSAEGASPTQFDFAVSVLAPPTNTTCAAAAPVIDGTSLPFENAADATGSLASACLPSATGDVLYYSATVPAGQTLTAIATPLGDWDTALRVFDACTTTSCVASSDSDHDGFAELLSYANPGATSVDLTLAVGSSLGTTPGLFGLQVFVAPPPYVATSITNACEDLGGVPSMLTPGPTGLSYGSGSTPYALPFAFPFMGTSMTHVSLAQWGYVQMLAGATGDTTTFPGDHAIPYPARPNGIVAPFWANLLAPPPGVPTSGPTDARLSAVIGAAPSRHITVEWRNWATIGSVTPVTFQARLFENGAIEFHYCDGFVGGSASSATIGAEDATGTHGFDAARAGVADTSHGLRLTPAM